VVSLPRDSTFEPAYIAAQYLIVEGVIAYA
jgi:hypothetical protein